MLRATPFRRIVSTVLRPLLGKTEISLVFHTSGKLVTRERAAAPLQRGLFWSSTAN